MPSVFSPARVAFILAGDMAFAYFMAHAPKNFFPMLNGGDAAVLYCFIFLLVLRDRTGTLGGQRQDQVGCRGRGNCAGSLACLGLLRADRNIAD